MKNIVLIMLLTFFSTTASAYMLLPIDEVYDGDTIKTHVSKYKLPAPLNLLSIRIRGIDTPELPAKSYLETGKLGRADCIKEAELALKAREFVKSMAVGFTRMKVDNFKWGKYGSRIVGDVKIGGVSVADTLINEGLAVPYNGGTKTHDWCL